MSRPLLVLAGCLAACRGLVPPADSAADQTRQRLPTPAARAYWDSWPRPSVNSDLSTLRALHANMVIGGGGLSDEGRGPLGRETWWLDSKADIAALQAEGIHYTGWIESQGQSRAFVVSVEQQPDGTFTEDPRTGAAELIASLWSWDWNGPGLDPRSNKVVWLALHSFVNGDPWQGSFVLGDPRYAIDPPTYPDGRPAVGFLEPGTDDPLKATLYDALCAKAIDGTVAVEAGDTSQLQNKAGLVPFAGLQLAGDLSFSKDVNAPFWLQYARDVLEFGVSHGSDGFWMDNASGWDSMNATPTHNAFGLWSVAKFRDYLGGHPELAVPGGAAAFDIRQYLRGRFAQWFPGVAPVKDAPQWADARFAADPLWRAFVAFKGETAHAYTKANYLALKAAATAAGRDPSALYLGGNDIPDITFGALDGDELDQVNTEYGPFSSLDLENSRGLPPTGHTGPFYATAASLEGSQHAIVWYYLDDPRYREKPNLGEVLGFEALANNVVLNTDPTWGKSPGTPDSMAKVNQAIERLAPTLGHRARAGAVALVFGSYTQATYFAPGGYVGAGVDQSVPGRPSHLDSALAFAGWAEALEERHTPYRVIPDYKLSSAALAGVSVLVLPHLRAIDAVTVESVLVPFARSGGTIIVTGADAGSLKTRAGAYGENGSPLLVDLTGRDLGPGAARFVTGNPGFDFYRGQRADPTRKAAARAQIDAALASLPAEVSLQGWGDRVWGTRYVSEDGQRAFFDLVNVDVDPLTDTLTAAPGGAATFAVPGATRAQWLDADDPTAVELLAQPAAGPLTVAVPAFRVYGTLVVDLAQPPTIEGAGTGCDDGFCVWVLGDGLGDASGLEVLDAAQSLLGIYAGSDVVRSGRGMTIRLREGSLEWAALANGPLGVRVFDAASGLRSAAVQVARPGGPALSAPQLVNAGPGCDDGFCLWMITTGLRLPAAVEVLDRNGALLATYEGGQLSVDLAQGVITLTLASGSRERELFATSPLGVRVVNLVGDSRSNVLSVTRP